MRRLASSVLIMQALVVAFAMLVAKDLTTHSAFPSSLVGSAVIVVGLLSAGLLKRRAGWILGWLVQFGGIALGVAVPAMYFLGSIFLGLWIAAILVGRKVERIKADYEAQHRPTSL